MFIKLALRNVRRQTGDYLLYFFTVTLTVALMFAMNNVLYSKELRAVSDFINGILSILAVFVVLSFSLLLGFASFFMIRLRKREFGAYLTLGMTRGGVLLLYILETFLLSLLALLCGTALGVFFYQGIMMIAANLMDAPFTTASYSIKGLLLTVGLVVIVFVLSSAVSAFYIKRTSIQVLLRREQNTDPRSRAPALWLAFALLFFFGIAAAFPLFSRAIDFARVSSSVSMLYRFFAIVTLFVSVALFHFCFAKGLTGFLRNRPSFAARGANTFLLGQLSGSLRTNAMLIAVLAFLFTFAILGSGVSFLMKTSELAALNQDYPFDVEGVFPAGQEPHVSPDEARAMLNQSNEVLWEYEYPIYEGGYAIGNWIASLERDGKKEDRPLSNQPLSNQPLDRFIRESDFNALLAALGKPPLRLDGSYFLAAGTVPGEKEDDKGPTLEHNGMRCSFCGVSTDYPAFSGAKILAVVPDSFVIGLPEAERRVVFDLKEERYEVKNVMESFYYPEELPLAFSESGAYSVVLPEGKKSGTETSAEIRASTIHLSEYSFREYARQDRLSMVAGLMLGFLYLSAVCLLMAMAILSLKTLAVLSEERERYRILFCLGASEQDRRQALFRQIFVFFFLPFAVPLSLSLPTALFSNRILTLAGLGAYSGALFLEIGGMAAALLLLYTLYFTATYRVAVRVL